MFDKWKNVKTAGAVVILAAVVIFLFANVKIKSADSYRAEKSTGFAVENASKDAAESEAGILAEGVDKEKYENVNQAESEALETPGVSEIAGTQGESGVPGIVGTPETSGASGALGGSTGETVHGTSVSGSSNYDSQETDEQNQTSGIEQPATEAKKTIQVSIEIRCDSAVKVKDKITNPGIKEKIPDSGAILKETIYRVSEGTSVYELLSQAAAANGIAITANANKTYVTSINNLAQMMLSQQSGWKYSVNGRVPGMAASSYILQNGDKVKWFYVLSANEE